VFTHPHTDCSFVSIYLSLSTMLPSNRLSSTHFARIRSFHCTVISFNPFNLLRFILIYTPYFVISTLTHIVSAPTPSLCLRTSCIPCCCFFFTSPPRRRVQFAFAQVLYFTDTCEIYLTLAGCEVTNVRGPQSIEQITRIHVDTSDHLL